MAQEQTEKLNQSIKDDRVRPNDDVVVYTTEKVKSIYPVGTAVTLHSVQAAKWIESGKATKSPKTAKEKSSDPKDAVKDVKDAKTKDEDASL